MEDPRKYESIKRVVSVTGFVLDVVFLVYLLTSGWSVRIRDFSESLSNSDWVVVMVYALIAGAAFKLIDLPISFYSSYILEHRFGLSRQTFLDWLKDQGKALLIAVPLGVMALEVIYQLLRANPAHWWIYASLAFIILVVVMTNLAPVLLLPLFFRFKPVESHDLQKRVDGLVQRTGAPVCGVFEWSLGDKTRKANAAVVGLGNTRRIIVSDTLLENFTGEEIEVIMAHELCHHEKHHVWYGIAVQSMVTVAAFYAAHRGLASLSLPFGFRGISDVANFPLFVLVITALSLLVLPVVNYVSRRLETAADRYALDVTSDALAFVSSMEKLADLNLADKSPNRIVEFIFYSHPSVENRIKLAADRVGHYV